MSTTAIIGAGVMGETLLSGLIRAGRPVAELLVGEKRPERARELEERYAVSVVSNIEATSAADTVALVVKPQDMGALLDEIGPSVRPGQLVVSLAAGITTAFLESRLPDGVPVVRVMPNTPALVDEGMAAIAAGSHCDDEHLAIAEELLGSTGRVLRVPERQMDAVTAISGTGPAYVFFVVESMIEAGVHLGLPRATATELVVQTLVGSAKMLRETGTHPTGAPRAGHLTRRHHRGGPARARDPQGAGGVPGRDGGRQQPVGRAGRRLLTPRTEPFGPRRRSWGDATGRRRGGAMARPQYDDVYAALWPRLVRTAYAVSGDLGVAEDAVQTAFAKAYRSWRRISRLEAPEAYLRRMAVNEVLNDRRLARRRHEVTSAEPPERRPVGGPDDRRSPHDELWRAVTTLPPRQRAVLVLRYYEDLSEQQIAEVLGLPAGHGEVAGLGRAGVAAHPTRPPDPNGRGTVMDLEQQLRESYADRLGSLDLPGGDVGGGTAYRAPACGTPAAGRRARPPSLSVVAVAAAGHAASARGRDTIGPSHSVGHWRELPPAPLSPRADAAGVWTGREVIVRRWGGATRARPTPTAASRR